MGVFIRLDLFIIVLVVAFNLISGVSIDWMAYLVYFLLICIPTLVYIFGLSIGLMLVLKSQAITFVVLLGYMHLHCSILVISSITCLIIWCIICLW
jgi:hypothetical protein